MFVHLLSFILCCSLLTFESVECVTQSATKNTPQKKFNSCAPKNSSIKMAANTPAPKPIEKKKTQPAVSSRTITVKNEITHDQLGYKKFGMYFYPDKEFRVFINDKEIEEKQAMKVAITNNILNINFKWDFGHKHKKSRGSRRVAFNIPPTANTVELTFDWKTKSQVLIENIDDVKFMPDLSDTRK